MKKYVWTKQSEEKAIKLGLEPRIAGAEATCGYRRLNELGSICSSWLAQGSIEEVEVTQWHQVAKDPTQDANPADANR